MVRQYRRIRQSYCRRQSSSWDVTSHWSTLVSISTNEPIVAFDLGLRYGYPRSRLCDWKWLCFAYIYNDQRPPHPVQPLCSQFGFFRFPNDGYYGEYLFRKFTFVHVQLTSLIMNFKSPPMVVNCYYESWHFGPRMCEIYAMLGSLFGCASIWTMTMIAFDRYNVIVKGLSVSWIWISFS